ncbi:MAG: hypothetical protein QG614_383 [Patescibacteria group bacterium]|nr:hypothetical protein [Patescibacteria group bacterium]
MKFKKETIKHIHLIYLIFFSILIVLLFGYFKGWNRFDFNLKKSKQNAKASYINNNNNVLNFALATSSDEDLKNIKAKSYLVYDLNTKKVLIGYNENKILPLASVSKLMTAYVAEKNCADKLKVELDRLLIASDNSAADDIAANCPNYNQFIDMMNEEVKKNSLNMKFINPSGLDINDETEASNFGDAVSVAKLLNMLYELDSNRLSHTTADIFKTIKNTNQIADNLPFLVGGKTGFTDMAGGNLSTIYNIMGTRIAVVVLGSTKEDRFTDTILLLKSYLNNIF